METVIVVNRIYDGKYSIDTKMYNLIFNLIMEYLLNNQNNDYNKIANRNV